MSIKSIIKRKKIHRLETQKSQMGSHRKSRRHEKKAIRLLAAAVLLLVIIVLVVLLVQTRTYHKYTVINSQKNEDTQSSGYADLGGCLLKYTGSGATLLNEKDETVWKQEYTMDNPFVDISETTAVIYDKNGTLMQIVNQQKSIGEVTTNLPILKARVAKNGTVAAILEDGEKTWINFYAPDGSIIAENQTRIESPGYPVDLDVSYNGKLIMITYLYIENGKTISYIAYYNFGDEGQSEIDNIVSGYNYDGIVPQVAYLSDSISIAFREDGFSVYRGGDVPKEKVNKKIDKEIVSTFYNQEYIGVVYKSGEKGKQYVMQVFDLTGKERFSVNFNIEYTSIKISDDMIILNNESQVCMYSLKGKLRFNSVLDEGAIQTIFKTGSNKYTLVTDSGIKKIKLK